MKKVLSVLIIALCAMMIFAGGAKETAPATPAAPAEVAADSNYTIRIYSNSNSTERTTWLIAEAKAAGFNISIDNNSVISGDTAAVQAANENKDGDVIFGLNETRWSQLVGGVYENIKLVDYVPEWADTVGSFKFDGKAYGLVIQNILMLYRTDEYGTNGEELHFKHWSDIVDCDYIWYRQGKVGGTTNGNINNSMLYPYTDPSSPAGGITVEGWKKLWDYCKFGVHTGDSYGFDPLNRGDVQVSTFYSSSLYGKLDAAAEGSKNPLTADNWKLVDIEDGTYYIAEYIGIVDKAGRTDAQTAQVKAFVDWFGSAEVQAAWAEEFDSVPCNAEASAIVYPEGTPEIYQIPNFALNIVPGTDMNYASYVAAHSAEWTNIMTNLGFYWKDLSKAPADPDWDNLDWATLCQKQ
ncbi:MAG: extracellular solute-binding protein [Sphaerochaetaceae bacterium]|nr:extracellular solute-binding protein [Sphaerochaetaceae bacterium]